MGEVIRFPIERTRQTAADADRVLAFVAHYVDLEPVIDWSNVELGPVEKFRFAQPEDKPA